MFLHQFIEQRGSGLAKELVVDVSIHFNDFNPWS
jgi:hypothetical protein